MGIKAGPGATGDIKDHSPPLSAVSSRSDEGDVVQRTYGLFDGELKSVAEVNVPFLSASFLRRG
jgi:hypothetical protein